MKKQYTIGIDLGGTKILTALCDFSGEIIVKNKNSTERTLGESQVIQNIKNSVYNVISQSGISIEDIAGIGISSPGPLSVREGVVISAPILRWNNVPICNILQEEFNIPVCLENDANAAAYGELLLGAGKGYANVVYITISTGIGCGIIIDKKIYHGRHDSAGELGHICLEPDGRICDCGNSGCFETYASGTAIERIAKEYVEREKSSKILELAGDRTNSINCFMVEMAAYEGDSLAARIWDDTGRRLGHGISILMQLLDPDIVVIGGGVSKAWKLFYDRMIDIVKQKTHKLISKDMVIVPSLLGENSGVLGAAMIAAEDRDNKKTSIQLRIGGEKV